MDNSMIGKDSETSLVPDLLNAITAFRTWSDLTDEGLVPFTARALVWKEPVQKAVCYVNEHQKVIPDPDCSCGLYGFYSLKTTIEASIGVVGVCEYFGSTQVHEKGLRSEYAGVKALAYNHHGFVEKHFREHYRVSKKKIGLYAALAALVWITSHSSFLLGCVIGSLLVSFSPASFWMFVFSWMPKERKAIWKARKRLRAYCKEHNLVYCKNPKQLEKYNSSPMPQELKPNLNSTQL